MALQFVFVREWTTQVYVLDDYMHMCSRGKKHEHLPSFMCQR